MPSVNSMGRNRDASFFVTLGVIIIWKRLSDITYYF